MSTGVSRTNFQTEFTFQFYHSVISTTEITNDGEWIAWLTARLRAFPQAIHMISFIKTGGTYAEAFNESTSLIIPRLDQGRNDTFKTLDSADTTLFLGRDGAGPSETDFCPHTSIDFDEIPELKFIGIRNVWDLFQNDLNDPTARYKPLTALGPVYNIGGGWLQLGVPLVYNWKCFQFCPDVFTTATGFWRAYEPSVANAFRTKYENKLISSVTAKFKPIAPFSHLLTAITQGGPGLPQRLNDLTDVQHVEPPANGEVLTWVTANNQWESLPAGSGALGINRTNDGQLFRVNKVDAVPVSGQAVFWDSVGGSNVGPESGLVNRLRIHKDDANGMASLWPQLHPGNTNFSVAGQFETGDISIRQWNFIKDVDGATDSGTYWEFDINNNGGVGTFAHLDLLVIDRLPIDVDVQYKLTNPVSASYFYDYGAFGAGMVATPVLDTFVQVPTTNFATNVGSNGIAINGNDFEFINDYLTNIKLEWHCSLFADVQDTQCELALFKNGVEVGGTRTLSYAKNETAKPEGVSTLSIIDAPAINDLYSLRVRWTEDNTPDPNPTQISWTTMALVITQV